MTGKSRRVVIERSAQEFADVDLADARRDERLLTIVAAVAAKPKAGFPRVVRSPSELEALYRLLRNPSVDWRDILAPHIEQSVARALAEDEVLVPHDTSEFSFRGESGRDGLGVMPHGNQGFFGHFALGVTSERVPLGLLGLLPFTRAPQERVSNSKAAMRSRKRPQAEKESDRWRALAVEVEEALGDECRPIHLMDREADSFPLLAAFSERGSRYVIRSKHDRVLEAQDGLKLRAALEKVKGKVFRSVPLSRRGARIRTHAHPPRDERVAHLHYRALTALLPCPEAAQAELDEVRVNVVHVFEPKPPPGEAPIDWLLLTSEPIDTEESVARVIDFYRTRWVIEEYFKALKTGCAFEKRQLESYSALLNALAMLAPIAWSLLLLRSTARNHPNMPATELFSRDELKLLRALSERVKLTARPTVREAMLALAGLGGHLKNNGEPGWQTLAAGYDEFVTALRGWAAAKRVKM